MSKRAKSLRGSPRTLSSSQELRPGVLPLLCKFFPLPPSLSILQPSNARCGDAHTAAVARRESVCLPSIDTEYRPHILGRSN